MVHAIWEFPPPMRPRGERIPTIAWTIDAESLLKMVKDSLMLVPMYRARSAPVDAAGTARGPSTLMPSRPGIKCGHDMVIALDDRGQERPCQGRHCVPRPPGAPACNDPATRPGEPALTRGSP
jgi:hypothetical protein